MAAIIDWPFRTLTPVEIGIDHAWNSRDGGAGLNGVTQIVSPLSGLWEMSVTFSQAREAKNRAYRATKMKMKGRFGWVRFAIFDPFRVRFADAGWPEPSGGIPFSDGEFFSDGSGFASPDITTTVGAAGLLGAEEVALNADMMNDALGVGHFFSIDDYLHLVTGIGPLVGSSRTYEIGPPLRADVTVGDEVKIGRPTILCRLADDRSGAIRMRFGRFGEPSMEFVEVLERE